MNQIRNQRGCLLAMRFARFPSFACSSTLKMEATCSSETSVDFERTTRHCSLEDSTLHGNGHCSKEYCHTALW
jgi:hypothetical protein